MNESGMDPRVLERCFNCMEQLHYPEEVCPSCGWDNHNRENVEDELGQTVLNNQYIVGRALGRGGFGITYVGFDRNLKIRIAIKEYYPVAISRRMNNHMTVCPFTGQENEQDYEEGKASVFAEGQTVAALGQISNVLRVYNVFEANNTVYIIMEYVEGETLAQLVKKQGPMKWPTVLELMNPVMDALQKIHDRGVIHRDVSPDNIMTNRDMTKTVLLDFGAARVARRGRTMTLRQGARQVQQGDYEVVLRPGYAPIEQYNAKSRLDGRVDEYAACATMYFMLTGRTPEDSMQLMITHASLEKPSKFGCKLPAEVEKALMKGLSLERDKRYKTVSELKEALNHVPFPRWKVVATVACVSGALVILVASGLGRKIIDIIIPHPTATPNVTVPPQTDAPQTAGPTSAAPTTAAPTTAAPPTTTPTPTPTPVPEWQRMRADTLTIDQLSDGEGTVLGSGILRSDITSIAFSGSLEGAPGDAWDVSEAGDGSVLAWVSDGALTIAGNSGVRAPEDAMGMFANYKNARSIRLNGCLDTSETTNMLAMFYRSSAVEELDLTGLDTSAATDMGFMFDGLNKLKALDVSGFNTGRVENMSTMFQNCTSLETLDVSGFNTANVTAMDYMFNNCTSLKGTLDVSGFDTGKVTSFKHMFYGCSALEEIRVGQGLVIGDGADTTDMFKDAPDPFAPTETPVPVPEWQRMRADTLTIDQLSDGEGTVLGSGVLRSEITSIAFSGSLEGAPADAWDVSEAGDGSVLAWVSDGALTIAGNSGVRAPEDATGMFANYKNARSIRLNGCLDTSETTNMLAMFYRSSAVEELDLTGLDTSAATDMGFMFDGLNKLKALDVSGFNTGRVENMSTMFQNCTSLETLDVSGFNTANVTAMDYMFNNCTSLKGTLDVSRFDTGKVTNFKHMFYGCSALEEIHAGQGFVIGTGANTGGMFNNTPAAILDGGVESTSQEWLDGRLGVSPTQTTAPTDAPTPVSEWHRMRSDVLGDEQKKDGTGTVLGSGILRSDITSIAFSGSLEGAPADAWDVSEAGDGSVKAWVSDGALTIAGDGGVQAPADARRLFEYPNVTSIQFNGRFDTSNTTDMYCMFEGCAALETLDVSGFNTANATDMSFMFYGCGQLKALDVSGFDTSKVTAMTHMFDTCQSLEALDVSRFNTARVTDMRSMFNNCGQLKTLDVSGFDTSSVTNMSFMFSECGQLKALDVTGFNTANVEAMDAMFQECSSLQSLNLSGFNTANVTAMDYMFHNCSGLKTLDVSSFDTHRVTNMRNMFYNCASLKALDIASFDTSSVTDFTVMFSKSGILKGGLKTSNSFVFLDAGDLVVEDIFSKTIKFDVGGMKREDWQEKMTVAPQASDSAPFDSVDWLGEVLVELGYSKQEDIDKANGKLNGKMKQQVKAFKKAVGLTGNSLVDVDCIRALCAELQRAAHQ